MEWPPCIQAILLWTLKVGDKDNDNFRNNKKMTGKIAAPSNLPLGEAFDAAGLPLLQLEVNGGKERQINQKEKLLSHQTLQWLFVNSDYPYEISLQDSCRPLFTIWFKSNLSRLLFLFSFTHKVLKSGTNLFACSFHLFHCIASFCCCKDVWLLSKDYVVSAVQN